MSRPARAALGAALVLGSAAGALVLAPGASAAPLPTPSVSKSTVTWNEYFTISGTGCLDPSSGTPGGVAVTGPEFGDGVLASADGSWSIPSVYYGVPSGRYTLTATCQLPGGLQTYPTFGVTVAAPGASPEPAPAPPPVPSVPSVPSVTPRATPTPARSAAPPPASPTPAPPPPASPTPAQVAPGPAAGCTDCARVSPEKPLEPGERLSLSWTGFQPGEQVTVVMRSTPVTLGTFTADAAGTVTAAVELPDEAGAGAHTLTFSGSLSGDLVVLPFRIAEADMAAASATVPAAEAASDEGTLTPWLAGGGLAVLLLGAGGVTLHRRRRAAAEGQISPALPAEDEQLARASVD